MVLKAARLGCSVIAIAVGGCYGIDVVSWDYRPSASRGTEGLPRRRILVDRTKDLRPTRRIDMRPAGWIPLVPCALVQVDRIEATAGRSGFLWSMLSKEFDVSGSVTGAISEELDRAALFGEVVRYGDVGRDVDYVLRSELEQMRYWGIEYTYGMSVVKGFLHLVLPYGCARNVISMSFYLEDARAKQIVWRGSFTRRYETGVVRLFDMTRQVLPPDRPSDFQFVGLLQAMVVEDLIPQLERHLGIHRR
jgi:hypothetical protein